MFSIIVNAVYKEYWSTGDGGIFPTNTWLIDSDWSLLVNKEGYPELVLPAAVSNVSPGDVIDLGDLVLEPVDANTNYDNAFKIQWEMFIKHVVLDEAWNYSLMEGAKGVQLAELGMQSWKERKWMDVPELG